METCTGTPSPQKTHPGDIDDTLNKVPSNDDDVIHTQVVETHMHPNFLYGKILPDGRPNFLRDYELSYTNCKFGAIQHGKCCVGGHYGDDVSFGHLYTISKSDKEERTYDEPYTGDLPRRSWLCCPGSQHHVDCEQPPLLDNNTKSPVTPSETITKPPSHNFCPGTCVRINRAILCLETVLLQIFFQNSF